MALLLGFCALFFACISGCTSKPKGIIGNVSVTTQETRKTVIYTEKGPEIRPPGRQNLALATVGIYTEAEMEKATRKIESWHRRNGFKNPVELNDNLIATSRECERLKNIIKKNSAELQGLEERIKDLENLKREINTNEAYTAKWHQQYEDAKRQIETRRSENQTAQACLDENISRMNNLNSFLGSRQEGMFQDLMTALLQSDERPVPSAEVITDSNGDFAISELPSGRLVICVRYKQKKLGGNKNFGPFFWLVYMPEPLPPDRRVLLTEKNLFYANPETAFYPWKLSFSPNAGPALPSTQKLPSRTVPIPRPP